MLLGTFCMGSPWNPAIVKVDPCAKSAVVNGS
jgi:hypothetical protein